MATTLEKGYVNRGTQTDFPGSLSRRSAGSLIRKGLQVSRVHHGYISSSSENVSNNSHPRSSTQLDSAYSHSLSADSSSLSLSLSPMLSSRVSKRRQLTYNRPPEGYKSANRLVSLPEATLLYSIRNELDSTALRIVSMPERDRPNMPFPDTSSSDCFEVSASSDNSYLTADDDLYSRVRVVSSNLPDSPSPPSSPESVMIIANNMQLPDAFLRHKAAPSRPALDEDEGWITWASSPPRPIPALHGPLSLPYARCPSGAEGTIVEGPDDLSRMIWGLGADDSQPSHPRDTPAPQKAATHQYQSNFPPRLQKAQTQHSQNYTTQTQRPLPNAPVRSAPMSDYDLRAEAALHQRALASLGSRVSRNTFNDGTVLDNLLRTGATADPWTPIYRDSFIEDLRQFDMEGGLKLDWQSTIEQPSLQNSDHQAELAEYLKPLAPDFVVGGQTAQHSYPRIFVEPRLHQTSKVTLPPPRLSAIEIAHKYRQQQQLQNALPTPPSSSFSQWSPYISHEVSISSDPVTIRSSRLPPGQIQLQQNPPIGSSRQLRRSGHQHLGTNGQKFNDMNPPRDAPAQIRQISWSQPASQRSPDGFVPQAKALPRHRVSPSIVSPPQPGPPPNTPLPPLPAVFASAQDSKYHIGRSVLGLATPPSPTSPEARTRSLSYQQPRSIPLARLIQRRLSSVPEEDLSSVAERARSPPPPPQPKLTFSHANGQPRLRASFHPQHPTVSNPNAPPLSLQTVPDDDLDREVLTVAADIAGAGRATVKLPYKPNNGETKGRARAPFRTKVGKDNHPKGGDINGNPPATKEGKKKARGKKVKTPAPAHTIASDDTAQQAAA